MNKKTLYTILIIIFIVVILFFCLRYYYKEKETNINLSNNNSKESIKENTINENNTTKEEKEIIPKKEENNSDNKIPEETIIKDEDIAVSKDKITIIDESKDTACASAIEYYYEDNNYKYYFTCIKSGNIFVIVDGKKYNIKEALNNKVVTMADNKIPEETIIKDEDIAVSKDKITIIDESKDTACASAIEYYYEDNNYKYYFTCIKSGNIFVIVDGKKYNIKEALNNKVVTMAELESNGFKPLKEEKNLQKY